jgi:outer membrane lipase/esterase
MRQTKNNGETDLMRDSRFLGIAVISAAALMATTAGAQQVQNLSTFVNDPDNGATSLQRATANAVQDMCGTLASLGGLELENPQQLDLFKRCNELVATAQEIQGGQRVGRTLGLAPDELLAAVQQISGEELHSQSTLSTRVTNGQFSNIAGRLNTLRLGGFSAAGGGRVAYVDPYDNRDLNRPGFADFAMFSGDRARGGGASADISGSRVGWFLDGSFNTGDRDQTANEDAFDFDATSITLGIDYLFDSGVIGISAGLDNYEADFDNTLLVAGGKVEVDGTTGSLFGAWYPGAFYVDGILSFGDLDSDVSRRVVYDSNNPDPLCDCPGENRTLTGDTGGDFIAAGVTVGYDLTRGNWDISTTLSLSYRDVDIDGYDERDSEPNGGLALRFASHSIESFRSILGFAFTRNISRSFGVLSPQLRVEWHHEFEDDPITLDAKYVVEDTILGGAPANDFTAACISCFRFSTDEVDTDFALVGIGMSAVFTRRLQVYGAYDALLGLDNLTSNTFSLGIRGQF